MRSTSVWGHTVFAILSLAVFYPLLGQLFAALLFPYVAYMVFSKKAGFLPALAIQASVGGGMVAIIIFISFMILSVVNYKNYDRNIRVVFWLLLSVLPIVGHLAFQRYSLDGDTIQLALVNAGMLYFGLFGFFYGFAISRGVTKQIIMTLIWGVILIFILILSDITPFQRITLLIPSACLGVVALWFKRKQISHPMLISALILSIYLIINSEDSTFTNLAMMGFTFLLVWFYYKGKSKAIMAMTGIAPFCLIVWLLYVGITTYKGVDVSREIEGINLTSYDDLMARLQFKFFGDRAPIWSGAFNQVIVNNSLFPIHDLSNVIQEIQLGAEIEFEAGAHTTFLEYLRKYGYLVGGVLIFCYIRLLIISRRLFNIPNIDPIFIVLLASAVSVGIFVALTGTSAVLTAYAILSFGVYGIAYGLIKQYYKK